MQYIGGILHLIFSKYEGYCELNNNLIINLLIRYEPALAKCTKDSSQNT